MVQNSFEITPDLFNNKKDDVFVNKDKVKEYIEAYERKQEQIRIEQQKRDSIYNCKLRLARAKKDLSFGTEDNRTDVSEGDTIAIYTYNDSINCFLGRFHYTNLRFEEDEIRFLDEKGAIYSYKGTSEDKDYLKSKNAVGIEDRFSTAFEYDSIRTAAWIKDIEVKYKAYKDRVSYMKAHQIFITKADYNYDDDQFGMDYTFYNCFGKTIKYISVTLACYNNVGDLQRDYLGRAVKTVRGIGPIAADEEASYSWEKIFWDEYDVIKNCKITAITFTFKDGTTRSFKGIANINKHFASNAWDD